MWECVKTEYGNTYTGCNGHTKEQGKAVRSDGRMRRLQAFCEGFGFSPWKVQDQTAYADETKGRNKDRVSSVSQPMGVQEL